MKTLIIILFTILTSAKANNLRSIPCQYLMRGEVLASGGYEDFRFCVINTSPNKEDQKSYILHIVDIWYATNTVTRTNQVVMPFCTMSQVSVFSNGTRTMFMVDTLSEDSPIKILYRRTCP